MRLKPRGRKIWIQLSNSLDIYLHRTGIGMNNYANGILYIRNVITTRHSS